MKVQEKMWKEWIWEEKDQKDQWEEFSGITVSEKVMAERALERVVERVTGKKMAEKAVVEAAEELRIRQIKGIFLEFFGFRQELTWSFSCWSWRQ